MATEVAKTHLKEHGWVKIPGILTKSQASEALDKLWKAKAKFEANGESTFFPTMDPNAHNVRIFYLPELDALFRDMLVHPTTIEMVKSVLGEHYLISNFSANIARPGARSMALHSDQSIVLPDPWLDIWSLNIIWCLTDATADNGSTQYIPGSNKWVYRSEVPANAPEMLVPFEAEAGDIILMDGRLWHTSGNNVTVDQDRALLFAYYCAPYMRPLVNWTAKLPQNLQDELSPELKERFALSPTGYSEIKGDLRYLSDQYPSAKLPQAAVLSN